MLIMNDSIITYHSLKGEIINTTVIIDNNLAVNGNYNPLTNSITLKHNGDTKTLYHEVSHMIVYVEKFQNVPHEVVAYIIETILSSDLIIVN